MKSIILVPIIVGSILLTVGGAFLAIGIVSNTTQKKVENTYELKEDFNKIDIDLDTSDLEFKVTTDGTKKVVCNETNKQTHSVEVVNNELTIKQHEKRQWFERIFSWGFKMKVTVYMPSMAFEKLEIKSSTGDIIVPEDYSFDNSNINVSTGNIKFSADVVEYANFESSTGNMNLSEMSPKALKAKASTGNITLNKVEAEETVNVEASTGDIHFIEVTSKDLDVKTSTGGITFTSSVIANHINAKASTGNVRFEDSDANTLSIKTSTGDVKGTLLTSKIFSVRTDTGKIKVPTSTVGGLCEITTNTGDIEISIKG
jgi:DUF4097 and DUF4098 domain-containing protein YvlB